MDYSQLTLEAFTAAAGTENGLPRYTLTDVWNAKHTVILTPSEEFDISA